MIINRKKCNNSFCGKLISEVDICHLSTLHPVCHSFGKLYLCVLFGLLAQSLTLSVRTVGQVTDKDNEIQHKISVTQSGSFGVWPLFPG